MANVAMINKQVEDICGTVESLNRAGRIRYSMHVLNPTLGHEPVQQHRGSNADNNEQAVPQNWYYGSEMPTKFREQLTELVNNPSVAKIFIDIKDGASQQKAKFEIVLRDEYTNYPQPQQQMQPAQPTQQPAQPMGGSIFGMDNMNDFFTAMFGGLSGTERSGLGAVIGFRDQLVKNEYERRDAEREHLAGIERVRNEYERKELDRQLADVRKERDDAKSQVRELEEKLRRAERDIEKKEDEIYDLEEKVTELEKMKPEHSLMGVSLTGIGTKVVETLAMKHAGTLGKLLGVDKESMLGMLQADNEEPMPMPQQSEQCTVTMDGDENPRAARVESLRTLIYSLSEDEFEAFWSVICFIDENRDKMMEMGKKLMGE